MQVIMVATGQVKEVPDGYARNYLLPKKLAMAATADSLVRAKEQQAQQAEAHAAQASEYQALVAGVTNRTVTVSAKASATGRLFSAVHADDIIAQLQTDGVVLPPLTVTVPPIKQVGTYEASVRLPGQPTTHFSVVIQAA